MKWTELPKLIREGDKQADYTLPTLVYAIRNYCDKNNRDFDYHLQLNPDFQRGHVWTEEQQIRYIETLLIGGAKHARIIYLNCPDWNLDNETDYHDFTCVDGLQRFTAIEKFVENKIPAFGTLFKDFEDYDYLKRYPMVKININNLKSREEVLRWYLQINDGGTPHTKEEIDRVKKLLKECK